MDSYICKVCGEEYLREDLKLICEQVPAKELPLRLGTVFKCEDGIFGILYNSRIEKQTHFRSYVIARTSKDYVRADGIWLIAPEVIVPEEYLSQASPVTDEEFDIIKKTFERHKEEAANSNLEHVVKLRELELIPLKI